MTSPTHQAVDSMSHPGDLSPDAEFPQFSRFPVEIRLEIWRHPLKRYRKIRVYCDLCLSDLENPAGEKGSDGLYYQYLLSGTTHLYSNLLSVNREARFEALRFYRYHMPRLREAKMDADGPMKAVIYLNPEYDALCFVPWGHRAYEIFFEQIKEYDRRNVGDLETPALDTSTTRLHWNIFFR